MTRRASTDRPSRPHRSAAVELGLVSLSLVTTALLASLAYRFDLLFVPDVIYSSSFVPYVVGFAGCSAGYARYRGHRIPIHVPEAGQWGTGLAVVLFPTVVTAAMAVLTDAAFGLSLGAVLGETYAPQVRFTFVLVHKGPPAVFAGLGFGVLSCGVVQESIRRRVTAAPDRVIAFTTGFTLFFQAILWGSAMTLVAFFSVQRLLQFGFAALSTVAAGIGLGLGYRDATERSLGALSRPIYAPVFALGLLAFVGAATVFAEFPDVFEHVLWAVAFATAAFGYERTRSMWVPVATIALFQFSFGLVGYVEATGIY